MMTGACNILVVEDDPMIGLLLVELLIAMGHGVCGLKTNAFEAIASAGMFHPDLLVVDINLDRSSGIDAVSIIRRSKAIPYLYMTGARIPAGGPHEVILYKPFMEADLASAIKRAMAPARLPEALAR
jgi:CheY-like chemotaxis protein